MADPTAEEKALEQELDALLDESRHHHESRQTESERAAEPEPAAPEQVPASIEELDEKLSESTPVDLDLRAEQELEAIQEALSDSAHEHVEPPPEDTPVAEAQDEVALDPERVDLTEDESAPGDDADDAPAYDTRPRPRAKADAEPSQDEEEDDDAIARSSPTFEPRPAPRPSTDAPEPTEQTEVEAGSKDESIVVGQDAEAAAELGAMRTVDMGSILSAPLKILSAPLVLLPPQVRDMIGWLALVTAFNAVCIWAYLLLVD